MCVCIGLVRNCRLKVLPLLRTYGSVVTLVFQGMQFLIAALPDHRKRLWFVHLSHRTSLLPACFTRVFTESEGSSQICVTLGEKKIQRSPCQWL